mmetsp:Transcript_19127/g.35223  ORF Transcript_19127/g.35223 Transcript_19127/m.35223 type:complete len:133 (+) Transcript_19127:84-482(+)
MSTVCRWSFPCGVKAICSLYAPDTITSVCTSPNIQGVWTRNNVFIANGFCGLKKIQESVSTMNMIYALIGLSAVFGLISFVQHRLYQVKCIIAEYMPLEGDHIQNTSVSEEDGEFMLRDIVKALCLQAIPRS